MGKSHKWWVISAICVFVIGISGFGFLYSRLQADKPIVPAATESTESSTSDSLEALELLGQTLPSFNVTDKEGNAVSSQSFYDKPMVIVDWASWCPHCQEHLPVVQKVYEEFGDKVHFVMINLTDAQEEPQDQAAAYISEKGYTFPFYFDQGQGAANALKVEYIPTTYIVDKNQRVTQIFSSEMEEKELTKAVESVLD